MESQWRFNGGFSWAFSKVFSWPFSRVLERSRSLWWSLALLNAMVRRAMKPYFEPYKAAREREREKRFNDRTKAELVAGSQKVGQTRNRSLA